jgi:adenosylhomocysteine nucleosidase
VLAIVSAMQEEIAGVIESLAGVTTQEFGKRQFHTGRFCGTDTVVVFSRYGKVAAAATATQLLASYPVSRLVFSGVAGAIQRGLNIGDIVVGTALVQHDMDATPLFKRYEVPLLGKSHFATDLDLRERLTLAAKQFLSDDLSSIVPHAELAFFKMTSPKVVGGVIASGDKFFADATDVTTLRERLPEVSCVEMEGAAVAQVCDEYSVPFGVVRTISDTAEGGAAGDFLRFSGQIARHYSVGILSRFLQGGLERRVRKRAGDN